MADETRKLLKIFGVAVTNLEDAIDERASMEKIMQLDQEVADRTRDIIALVDRIRSRRIA
jgi:hypothetical protein